jgi:hypothetical protein
VHLKPEQCPHCGYRAGDLGLIKKHMDHKSCSIAYTFEAVDEETKEKARRIHKQSGDVRSWEELYRVVNDADYEESNPESGKWGKSSNDRVLADVFKVCTCGLNLRVRALVCCRGNCGWSSSWSRRSGWRGRSGTFWLGDVRPDEHLILWFNDVLGLLCWIVGL